MRANVRIAKAQAGQAALQYRSTVLKALQDVDNALVSYRTDQDRRGGADAHGGGEPDQFAAGDR